jgi:hypothetical protein
VTAGVDEHHAVGDREGGRLPVPHPVVEAAAVEEHHRPPAPVPRPHGQPTTVDVDIGPPERMVHDTQGVIHDEHMSTEVS